MKVQFSKPYITGKEMEYVRDLLENRRDISGDGMYTKKVHAFLEKKYRVPKALLTTSCTTALEFAVRLLDLKPGDEIIAPSFTFSSTINAILLEKGVKVVFAEIDKKTLNIDPSDIERKITKRTKALMVVHYAGVACDMDKIMKIAKKHKVKVIEDAAQGIEAKYKGKYLGTIGDFGCVSFHGSKNISAGECGALFINTKNKKVIERAEIIREKGTNRSKFLRGVVDKYTWVDVGSSHLPSDLLAAVLLAQLEAAEDITKKRMQVYDFYRNMLELYEKKGIIALPEIPSYATHNAHIFYILFKTKKQRDLVMSYMKSKGIDALFHYIPLHSSPQGRKLGYKKSDLPISERASQRLLRLPLHPELTREEQQYVIETLTGCLNVLLQDKMEKKLFAKKAIRGYVNPGMIHHPAFMKLHSVATFMLRNNVYLAELVQI